MSHEYEPTGEGAQRFMNAQWIQPDPNERAFREAGYVPDADGLWVKDPNYVAPAAPQQEMLRYGQVPPTTIDILTRITVNGSNQEHMDLLAAHALSNHLGMQQQRAPQPQPRDNPYLPQAYAPTYDSYGGSANEPTPPALPAGNSEWHPANQPAVPDDRTSPFVSSQTASMESANAWEQGRRTNVTDAAPSVDADIVRPPEGDGKKHIVRRSIAALMIAGMTFPVGWTANYWKEAGRMPDPVDVMLNFGDNLIFWS